MLSMKASPECTLASFHLIATFSRRLAGAADEGR
jgi:hypothetical protein